MKLSTAVYRGFVTYIYASKKTRPLARSSFSVLKGAIALLRRQSADLRSIKVCRKTRLPRTRSRVCGAASNSLVFRKHYFCTVFTEEHSRNV
jgi:hypothetical protein